MRSLVVWNVGLWCKDHTFFYHVTAFVWICVCLAILFEVFRQSRKMDIYLYGCSL